MKKKEMAVLAAVCAAAVGNLRNMEIIQAFAENGNGKILEIEETQEPLSICVEEENERMMRQIVTAWQKTYGGEQTVGRTHFSGRQNAGGTDGASDDV